MSEELTCKKCGSKDIEVRERGFKLGRAVVAGLILLPAAPVVGMIGRKKLVNRCMNCGHTFKKIVE